MAARALVSRPVPPNRNPSYPQRIHTHEHAHWQAVLKSWDDRIAQARQKLAALGDHPSRATFVTLYHQMLGARDQIADAAKRLPMQVGGMYDADHHRLEEAAAALERLFQRWEQL